MALVEFQPDTIRLLAEQAAFKREEEGGEFFVDLAAAEKALGEAHRKFPDIDEDDDNFEEEFVALYEEALRLLTE